MIQLKFFRLTFSASIKLVLTVGLIQFTIMANAQDRKYLSLSFLTTQSAMPFGKFSGMFEENIHPGFELTYGKNFSVKTKHDWFVEYKAGYFFHRFVQHGIPAYMNLGYRYRFSKRLSAQMAFGAGIMKSIPDAGVFNLGSEGYRKEKGKGRWQLIATHAIGLNYVLNPKSKQRYTIFTNYQQRVQFAFVKSYVPLLPYNNFMLGVSKAITRKIK